MIRRHAIAFGVAAAAAMAIVLALDFALRERIEQNRAHRELKLLKETMAEIDHHVLAAADLSELKNVPTSVSAMWRAMQNGQTAAAAVQAHAEGYGGEIVFFAAFDLRGGLLQTRIVRHSEAPGLADFLSLPDGGMRAIDGVSGATITSNAVSDAAREIGAWMRYNIANNIANDNGGIN